MIRLGLISPDSAHINGPGDLFSTGDVLLEIETDKAQMDVEAQDDGKMAKITQQAGVKGVKVGSRIAILAESDDDLSTLSLPNENLSTQPSSPSEPPKSGVDPSKFSESQAEGPRSSKGDTPSIKLGESPHSSKSSSLSKAEKQEYPLYPSVAQLLHEKGLSLSEADKIPASGPRGRLLKGDVLAYLGEIDKSYSFEQSTRITKLGHLDLSNVKAAPTKEVVKPPPSKATSPPPVEEALDTEVAIPISLSSVSAVQKRIQESLGVTLPLSTFLARATELANEDLPRSTAPPTADELFNDILGLNNISDNASRGNYIPQIAALPSRPISSEESARRRKEEDIYDVLAGRPTLFSAKRRTLPPAGVTGGSKAGDSTNIFSVSTARGEEKRARVFLERVKTILQVEPGRLIL